MIKRIIYSLFALLLTHSCSSQTLKPHPNDYGPADYTIPYDLFQNQRRRASACIVMLCRNSDLPDVLHSLVSFEEKFNKRFGYPYVFINDKEFTSEFIETVKSRLPKDREAYFDLIPEHEWSYPSHINQTLAAIWRNELGKRKVMYSHLESYRFMCSWFSGHFFRNGRIAKYEWYWRVEPGVDFYCDIDYDPFLFMEANGKQYAFNVVLKELASTVSSLWSATVDYVRERKLNPTLLKYFRDEAQLTYNLCHFWSNFEIAKTSVWNNPQYLDYFNYLDKRGGFFYERWGDAPVHSLGLAVFLPKSAVHFFNPIGYRHENFIHCSNNTLWLQSKCKCPWDDAKVQRELALKEAERKEMEKRGEKKKEEDGVLMRNFDWEGGSCLKRWIEYRDEPFW